MGSEEVTVANRCPNDTNDATSPQIGVFVTADVRVVQYRSNQSLGNCDSTKCTIVTSLSAVINESLNGVLRNQLCNRSKECVTGTMETPEVLSQEVCDHPVVRRSKKHTQLNIVNIREFTAGRRAQIDRTVLLPYLGCTKRFEPFWSYNTHILAKSSKSWETVGKSNKAKNLKPFRSQTFNNKSLINRTFSETNFLDFKDLIKNEQLVYSLGEYELSNEGFNIEKGAVRSFYLIKTPISGDKTFSGRKSTLERDNNLAIPATSYLNKNELHKDITGFKGENLAPSGRLNFKTTRNVSILHRPKTRDKSTSTTSLDGRNAGQGLDKSIQGLLMPYISNGRDFPSEIVLKLVPKAEALKNALKENDDQANGSKYSSEVNLLAPTLNPETKLKKKSGKSFWNCFSNKKNTEDATSDEISNKEVYFPSIVEVHNKNKKLDDNSNSNMENSVSSFYNIDKNNKNKIEK